VLLVCGYLCVRAVYSKQRS